MPDTGGSDSVSIGMVCPQWPAPANVRAFITTRQGGFSTGPWAQLNLGVSCGDDVDHVRQNRNLLQNLLPAQPQWLKQVHGNRVVNHGASTDDVIEADAITSNRASQVCAILTADCLPVLFCNSEGSRIAAAHAGWRGLANGVLENTVAAMACAPGELMAWLGPAIGPGVYEVGEEVYTSFMALDDQNANAFESSGDRWLANLYELARMKLRKLGIGQVVGGDFCTYSEPDMFFSYRRDGITGRMASVIWLENNG